MNRAQGPWHARSDSGAPVTSLFGFGRGTRITRIVFHADPALAGIVKITRTRGGVTQINIPAGAGAVTIEPAGNVTAREVVYTNARFILVEVVGNASTP